MMLLPILTTVVLAASPVSLNYEGPLKEALKQIATKGQVNLIVSGDLAENVQVNLTDVPAEEALDTVARVYNLDVNRQGKLWVIRPKSAAALAAPPAPPAVPKLAAVPAPPSPPAPPVVAKDEASDDDGDGKAEDEDDALTPAELARRTAERAREDAEATREKVEAMRDQAQDLAEARREQADALREMARAHAELEKNRVSAGGPVIVQKDTSVDTAVAYGGPVIVEENAVVKGDAVAFGGDVVLKENAVVQGDAVSFGGSVIRGDNSVVRGETVSMGGTGLGSAISKGMVKSQRIAEKKADVSDGSSFGNRVAVFLLQFSLFFGLGFLMMMFAPGRMKAIEATIRAEPTRNGIAGTLALFAAIPASLLLTVTIIGIPVMVALWFLMMCSIPVGAAVIANTLGSMLPTGRVRKTQALVLALGLLALLIMVRIPFLGPVAAIAGLLVNLGAVIRTRFGQPPRGTPVLESPMGVTV